MALRLEESIGLATALNPLIGYYAATQIAREALITGRNVPEIVLDRGYLTSEQLLEALKPERLANLQDVTISVSDPHP
ncbi:Fumarate hydratase class II [compost metagenome]